LKPDQVWSLEEEATNARSNKDGSDLKQEAFTGSVKPTKVCGKSLSHSKVVQLLSNFKLLAHYHCNNYCPPRVTSAAWEEQPSQDSVLNE
jgi:hypothetical protein